ncbi:hypothetical protein WA588_005911, partial [Blastocystis sp. NMH]
MPDNHMKSEKLDDEPNLRHRTTSNSNNNINDPAFWKSVQELSLQEEAVYADINYMKGQVNPNKEKELFITRLLRNFAYFLFIITLAIDFVYTAYTSYEDKLWDVFTSCNVSYLMLLLCLSCDDPVAMFLFATAFIGTRFYTILLHQKYPIHWKVSPVKMSKYSLIFFFGFFLLDQGIEIAKSK